jgi:periplasmic divalent cation tolerance protein
MNETRTMTIVLTTVADDASADSMARVLIEERLAACVNRVAVESTYRWKNGIERGREVLLVIKSTDDLTGRLHARVATLGSYEVPEFVVLRPAEVAPAYLAWALDACGSTA